MKKFFILSVLFLCLNTSAFAAVRYNRNPSGASITFPASFFVSFDDFSELGCGGGNFNYWAIELSNSETIISEIVPSIIKLHTFVFDQLPTGDFSMVSADCFETQDGDNTNGIFFEGNGIDTLIFTSGGPPPDTGIKNADPQVKITTEVSGSYRGEIPIYYIASDASSGLGALTDKPITVLYSDDGGFSWQKIAEDQTNTGFYAFDTTKVPDGKNYKIQVIAMDGYGYIGIAESGIFSIDNTVPSFDISISPSEVREKDTIKLKITSSEELKTPPELKITQKGNDPKTAAVKGSGKTFSASYYVDRGSGRATVSVSGEDFTGNTGGIILSGGSFSVGFYGPPPPAVNFPSSNQIFSEKAINITGSSVPNTKIVLILNGAGEVYTQSSNSGDFKFENVVLSLSNKGYNTLDIFAVNEKGEEGQEVVLKVKLNSPPKISSTSITAQEVLSGQKEITWTSFDANEDELVFSVEYSNDGGVTWGYLVSSFLKNSYEINTTQLADGANYFIKITADDGLEKVSKIFKNVTIKNNLPQISLDVPAEYFTNNKTIELTGRVIGTEQGITSVGYSINGGKNWENAVILDESSDHLTKKFTISSRDPLEDGKYIILIRATDASNRSVKIVRSFTLDTSAPFIELPLLNKVVDSSMDSNLELSGLQVDLLGKTEPNANIKFLLEDKVYEAVAGEKGEFEFKNTTLLPHGSNKISLSASDLAGNVAKVEGAITTNNSPQISDFSAKEGSFVGGKEEISWKVNDPDSDPVTSSVFYRRGGGDWVVLAKDIVSQKTTSFYFYKWDTSKLKDDNSYQLKLQVTDGITPAEEVVNITVDNTLPEIESLSLPQNTFKKAFTLNVAGTALDNFSGVKFVEYSIDGEKWFKATIAEGYLQKKSTFKIQHPFDLKDGEYDFGVRAVDAAENVSTPKFEKIVIDTTPPRIGSYTISRSLLALFPEGGSFQIPAGGEVKFTASLEGDTKEAFLDVGEQKINLVKNKAIGLWEAEINFQNLGKSPMLITAVDAIGNSTENKEIGSFNIIPLGKVSFADSSGIKQAVKDAEINISVWNEESQAFIRWQAENYNEGNPVLSLENGEYDFALPSGKYQLSIQKTGFTRLKTNSFVLDEPAFINFDFVLIKRSGIRGFFENILEKLNP